jgi:hypothetical protein
LAEALFTRQISTEEIEKRTKGYPSWLEIDLDAITHNLKQLSNNI